ncbi:MAG: MraY family glycosyltransferase [Verrucomicrobiota bacterium]|jgi:UDP-GlcNAc:undecaprenyl-phosphate GlcNAc-1-phosphate transferase
MDYQRLILSCLVGIGVGVAVITLILRLRRRVDLPRRDAEMHHAGGVQKSRLGGVALAAAFVAIVVLFKALNGWQSQSYPMIPWISWKILAMALAMFGLGLWDDLVPLGARRKLFGQVAIAAATYFLGIGIHKFQIPFTGHVIDLGFWSCLVTVFWLVALTNLINLIDGVDGLAGGICLMLMILLVYVGGAFGPTSFIAAGMSGALLGFLWFNFPPARIYMGDGGAYFLGFLVGCLTISSSQKGTVFAALIAPLFVLALPILDTALAILRRGVRGLPLFRADRGHIHHRLLESGLSRRQVVLGTYAFTAIFLALGFAAFWSHGEQMAILLGLGMLIILLAAGQMNFSREWFAVGRILGNSLNMRAEIQYALAQTRWLVMEGDRCQSIAALCEDTVFIARKLGFDTVRIRLEDGERTWQMPAASGNNHTLFRHQLPGHGSCFIELGADCPKADEDTNGGDTAKIGQSIARTKSGASCRKNGNGIPPANGTPAAKEFDILSELLAEGWARAIAVWEKQNQLPARFDGLETPAPENRPKEIPGAQPETV